MKMINSDILNKILSFLPVIDEKRRNHLSEIRKHQIRRELETMYENRWFDHVDNYMDWLANDIGRWMNNDIALLREITPRYKHFIATTFDVNESDVSDTVVLYYERLYTSEDVIKMYFNYLSENEINLVKKFCDKFEKKFLCTTFGLDNKNDE